jgi:hypothetical protein
MRRTAELTSWVGDGGIGQWSEDAEAMTVAIEPGMWVECVDAQARDGLWLPGERLTEGAIYQVDTIFVNPLGRMNVTLAQRPRHPTALAEGRRGYNVDRVRPIYRPKEDVIRSLLRPVGEKEPA